jgi:nucleoside-triphosphatase THEP1
MAGIQAYARFNIIVGAPGTGKSTFVDQIITKTHFKNALVYIEGIDQGGKPFLGLPVISLFDYKGGKVCIDADQVEFDHFMEAVAAKYRNGLLIIDEAGMYKMEDKGKIIPPVVKLMKQRRKYNVEIYLIYHSVSEIPVRLFKWCNNVILFHQTDKFNHKGAVIPNIEALNDAKERIAARYFAGDVHYCERVQLS